MIVRFKVGEDEERAAVRIQQKLGAHMDMIPAGASPPLIKMRSIDDVPVLALTLWSPRYSGYELRRLAGELRVKIEEVPGVGEVSLTEASDAPFACCSTPSGSPRAISLQLRSPRRSRPRTSGARPARSRSTTANSSSSWARCSRPRETSAMWSSARRVTARCCCDVAAILDGPEEPSTYVRFGAGAAASGEAATLGASSVPAVTIAVAKHKGENAVSVVADAMAKLDAARGTLIPGDVQVSVTRDYGATASDKSNELLKHMGIAVISVVLLIWFALGRRESVIVLLAIPATLGLTLAIFYSSATR